MTGKVRLEWDIRLSDTVMDRKVVQHPAWIVPAPFWRCYMLNIEGIF